VLGALAGGLATLWHWVVAALVFGFLILVHELGHFIAARREGVRVERFSVGFGPAVAKWRARGVQWRIGAIPVGGYVALSGEEEGKGEPDEFCSKGPGARSRVIVAGVLMNALAALLALWAAGVVGFEAAGCDVVEIIGEPAKEAGLEVGDVVTAVDGRSVRTSSELQQAIMFSKEPTVALSVLRDGAAVELAAHPMVKHGYPDRLYEVLGEEVEYRYVGIAIGGGLVRVRYGPLAASGVALRTAGHYAAITYKVLWRLVTLRLSIPKAELMGPVGIAVVTSRAAAFGLGAVLQLAGIISLALALFNVLPIPLLDGGHLAFLAWEGVFGRPVPARVKQVSQQVSFMLILALGVVVTFYDILRIWAGGGT